MAAKTEKVPKKTLAIKQAVTVKCKQMGESGQNFCSSVVPEVDGDLSILKECQSVLNSAKTGHVAKFLVTSHIEPLTNEEVKEDTEDTPDGVAALETPKKEDKPAEPIQIMVFVPKVLEALLTAESWFSSVTGNPPMEVVVDDGIIPNSKAPPGVAGTFVYGQVYDDFPFKYQDSLVARSYAFIKEKNLYTKDEDDGQMFDFPEE